MTESELAWFHWGWRGRFLGRWRHLEVAFAASKIDNLTYTPNPTFGLEARDLNYLGNFLIRQKMQIPLALMRFCHQKGIFFMVTLGKLLT